APGLAAGNTVVMKPSEWSPGIMALLAEVMQEAAMPPGIFNVVYGGGAVGQQLVEHPGIHAIGFVGSHSTAEKIVRAAGLKPSIIEASGNGPTIVCEDADIDAAAQAAVYGAFFCAGQVCCATERVIAVGRVHDAFVQRVMDYAQQWTLGDPFNDHTQVGPMNNEPTAAKMQAHVQDALDKGATLLLGGHRDGRHATSLYFQPTVLDNVGEDTLIQRHETFGPLVPIMLAADDDEAIRLANDAYLGLQAAVFTKSAAKAFKYIQELRVGNVVINDSSDYWEPHVPFGGASQTQTGWGRIGGRYTMLDMTYLRTVTWDFS
ncbi:MAG: aldehyde dehydrogenase family protein, partial [Firmicutes bacterium]|nr:aldehyde dehydrogenase family protein [Bacillota bacterium]